MGHMGMSGMMGLGFIFVLIFLAALVVVVIAIIKSLTSGRAEGRSKPTATPGSREEIQLGGKIKLEEIECKKCGAPIKRDDLVIEGNLALVSCPFCGASYQVYVDDEKD